MPRRSMDAGPPGLSSASSSRWWWWLRERAGTVPLVAFGVAGVLGFGLGLYLYWRTGRSKPAVRVFADRVEFPRGHRRGVVPFAEVTNVRAMQWGGSIYPYTRASRFIILETADGEWRFGPRRWAAMELQETLVRALERSRETAAGA